MVMAAKKTEIMNCGRDGEIEAAEAADGHSRIRCMMRRCPSFSEKIYLASGAWRGDKILPLR